ncbi:hypothetical protein [Synechococcus sp. CBW1108]|nr:hypothetical protein [Synechococcus sp. CBW1108]
MADREINEAVRRTHLAFHRVAMALDRFGNHILEETIWLTA